MAKPAPASKTLISPAQMLSSPVIIGVGLALTVKLNVSVPVQLAALVTVTV